MPALTCLVDAAAAPAPPGFGFAADASLPAPGQFPGAPPTTNFPFTDAADVESLPWSPSLSAELYRIDRWGLPYFSANSSGNISVRPHGDATLPHQEIDLLKVIKKASESKSMGGLGLQLPLVVRFPDILKNRLESLQSAFDFAIHSYGYESHYQGVYPVKCNQDRFIVEDIVKFGSPFRFGLEAGSKPELLLAMNCLSKGSPDGLLVCNGFKDAEYISLALIARRLQFNTVIVLELEEELDLLIDLARKFCVRPVIGVRAKLRTKHSGHFGSTSGEKGKFGLNTTQILRVARKLESAGMLDCLQLLHFHIGSQIPSTELLADGVSEGAHVYSELVRLGASMRVIDIGGGLGIDYDGSKSPDSDISVGYTLEEYAATVVGAVQAVCSRKGVQHPILCSESGRAIVSHHSILIFEAVSATAPAYGNTDSMVLDGLPDECKADYLSMRAAAMAEEYDSCLIYADKLKQRCVEHFKNGSLCMEQLAAVDALYDFVSNAIGMADPVRTYHVNLSIFTSIPDYWAIGQLFPIMPIHRLEQKPGVRGVLSDLTCDSDGKISRFIGGQNSLMLHELEGDRNGGYAGSGSGRYYLGMFLGGAYQEALGGLHNLFGGPSIVRVTQSDGPHSFAVTRAVPGPSCGDVLRVMQHEPQLMFQTLKHRALELVHIHSSSEEEDVAVEEDDHGILNNAGFLVDSLARSFHNMPYLATAGEEMNVTGYCSDGNFSAMSSEGAISVEDDQWSYMCA